jgi:predicted dehydrogenase
MKKLRIGVVGAGIMGESHAQVYRNHPQCELVAVSDLNLERATAFAAKFGGLQHYPTCEEMLEGTEVDVVSVCTPDFAHMPPALFAANAGKHVLIEKPLAVTVPDAEALINAAQANKIKMMAQFSHRWVPAYRQAKDLLSKPDAGEPVLAYTRKNDHIFVPTHMIGWAAKTTPTWFLSSHDIDLVCWFFDSKPVTVYASAIKKVLVSRGIDTPDAIQAQVRFANGAAATFEACWIYPDTFPTMVDSFIEVITTGMVIHLDRKREQIEVSTEKSYQYPRNLLSYPYENGEFHGAVPLSINHFIRCILEDDQPLVTLESSLQVTRILDAIQRSIETNSVIQL